MSMALRTALVLKPMRSKKALPADREAAKDRMSPDRIWKVPPGMVTWPSRSTAQMRMSGAIRWPRVIRFMPSSTLPSGTLNLIISACPWAKESISSAVGR